MSQFNLDYRPRDPQSYSPPIGLIGCGGITKHHLNAYRSAGYNVVALCDVNEEAAIRRRDEFYPDADVFSDHGALLKRDDIEVVDIATHPPERPPIILDAIAAGKHVLSQKPFVVDLDEGEGLAEAAAKRGVRVAVNQNGRWAPHFAYTNEAVRCGLLGEVTGMHLSVHWDHTWVKGTEFEKLKHLILYDFAIHWFDIVTCFMGDTAAKRVYASYAYSNDQVVAPPLLGQALIEYENAQATLAFDADTRFGAEDRTFVTGKLGSVSSIGPNLKEQRVTIHVDGESSQPKLEGCWFDDGFHGTMAELLCSIDENREPTNNVAQNLKSLALCFAAVASAERHEAVVPGSVRKLLD